MTLLARPSFEILADDKVKANQEGGVSQSRSKSKPDHLANGSSAIQMNGIRVRKDKAVECFTS